MIHTIRKGVSYILYYSGITYLFYLIGTRKTLFLTYHRIFDLDDEFKLDPGVVSTSVTNFRKQMDYLSKKYNVISLEKFLERHKKNKKLPKNSVVIKFDDGYLDVYSYVYPILKHYNLPAIVFLTTNTIDKNDWFWWEKVAYILNNTNSRFVDLSGLGRYSLADKRKRLKSLRKIQLKLKRMRENGKNEIVKKLSKALEVKIPDSNISLSWKQINEMGGISFGSHTVTHPILTRVSIKKAKDEIVKSKEQIEKNTGKKCRYFCYPNGEVSDFNVSIKNLLKENGYECAVTLIPGRNGIDSDLFELKSMFVRYEEDMILFKNKLIGVDIILGNMYRILKRIV